MVYTEGRQRSPSHHEDRPRFLRRRVSPMAQNGGAASSDSSTTQAKWAELPESLIQLVLNELERVTEGWDTRRAIFAMATVCRAWRQVAASRLFQGLWEEPSPMTFSHPAQLFALSPRLENNLVKCYIVRERNAGTCGKASVLYRLFLGNDPSSNQSKFLLSAAQYPWQHTSLFLNFQATGSPCAKMMSSVLGTSHKLTRCEPSFFHRAVRRPEMGTDLPRLENLAYVRYKLRMKGMMRPRRLHVSLPRPETRNSHKTPFAAGRRRKGLLERICTRPHAYQSVVDSSGEGSASPRPSDPSEFHLKLVNKPPHWNEGLKCWCLNFRGRVKLASVKNFQLICDSDGSGSIVMQFGKVDVDVFIMDFNPAVISTVQAFSIALTSFEGKVLL